MSVGVFWVVSPSWLDASAGALEQLEMFVGFVVEVGTEKMSSRELRVTRFCRLRREFWLFI